MLKSLTTGVMLCLVSYSTFAITSPKESFLTTLITQKEASHKAYQNQGEHQPILNQAPFFKNHALMLFYASTCKFCKEFAPTLKSWADNQGALVIPLSLDNQSLPQFPNFLQATTELITVAFKGQPINYPALFVINKDTKALYPVSTGAQNPYELERRLQELMPKILAYEQKGGAV